MIIFRTKNIIDLKGKGNLLKSKTNFTKIKFCDIFKHMLHYFIRYLNNTKLKKNSF